MAASVAVSLQIFVRPTDARRVTGPPMNREPGSQGDAVDLGPYEPVESRAIDALILCGGLGSRLRPAVPDRPKALAPIAGRPFLDILLERLASQGLGRFVLCTGFRGDAIERAIPSLARHGEIAISREPLPLGTGGALQHALSKVVGKTFLACNGDSLSQVEVGELLALHRVRRARVTMGVVPAEHASEGGVVRLQRDGAVRTFEEKPTRQSGAFVNAGIYLLEREVLEDGGWPRSFSLEHDVFPTLVGRGLFALGRPGTFLDIGTPERFTGAASRLGIFGIEGRAAVPGGRPR